VQDRDIMINDLRFAIRALGHSKLFAASAVLTLALGIGVNTTIFALANGALFRSRPGIQAADRVAWIATVFQPSGRRGGMSYPDFLDYRDGTTRVFTDVAGYSNVPISLGSGGEPERVRGQMVTGSYFEMLGVAMGRGRALTRADDIRGGQMVAVISDRLWKRRFGRSPDVLRTPVVLNGRDVAVVGIAGPAFTGPAIGDAADIWMPMALWPDVRVSDRTLLDSRGSSWLSVLARLKPDVSLGQAQAAVSATSAQLAARYPDVDRERGALVVGAGSPVSPEGRSELFPLAGLLLTVTGLVLLIACANVANLLLARGAGRTLEISIRSSLGASRPRLIRQLLTESAILALLGAAGGLLLATWTADLLVAFAGADLEGLQPTSDYRVVLFTAAAGAIAVCASAIIPAFTTTRADVMRGLRATPGGGGRSRLQGVFVVTQLALSLVLLLGAGLSLSALRQSTQIDLGFTPGGLATASFDLVLQNYDEARRQTFRQELTSRVRSLGGVDSVTVANLAPLSGTMVGGQVTTAAEDRAAMTFLNAVAPAYFSTMQIPIVRGRAIDDRDAPGAPRTAVINQTLARTLWGDEDAIGRTVRLRGRVEETLQVVGVARDARYDEPTEDRQPFLYLPLAQESAFDSETLLVRSSPGAPDPGKAIAQAIRALDPGLPVYDVHTFDQILRERADKQRGLSLLFTAFGALALALAAVGLHGVMTYATARRTRELGVRLALGATPGQLAAMVARDGLRLGAIGTIAGTALGLPLARALGALFFGVCGADVAVVVAVCAGLNAVVLAAALLPARRAAALDPIAALRMD
jgi:putative ABC transport system permease protein